MARFAPIRKTFSQIVPCATANRRVGGAKWPLAISNGAVYLLLGGAEWCMEAPPPTNRFLLQGVTIWHGVGRPLRFLRPKEKLRSSRKK